MTDKKKQLYSEYISEAIKYMEKNIRKSLTFEDVLMNVRLGETYLKKIFKEKTGLSVMHYFKNMKIDEAKKLIDNTNMSFTQISSYLGYDSIHYFSRQFKTITGLSPTQYRQKGRIDK